MLPKRNSSIYSNEDQKEELKNDSTEKDELHTLLSIYNLAPKAPLSLLSSPSITRRTRTATITPSSISSSAPRPQITPMYGRSEP
ncbi:hypothetical protein LSM04_001493 [Trypanosoma melophagium]|uniref:uncharacterized protein n=1 Tax=Trypanosoma melophagium TaxID=715481 RepID=UPI00351A523D|nr:hypothetical protein LSM04_001493 [Trypanosoma melophagium]